jgi:hypothetical protein
MVTLADLGFSKGIIFETIVSTFNENGEPNAAPMGVTIEDNRQLTIGPYTSALTYKNLQSKKCAVVNLSADPELFYITAFKEVAPDGKLPLALFGKAKSVDAPRIVTADAQIEVSVEKTVPISAERVEMSSYVRLIRAKKALPKAYCRASFATIEAIIYATRVKAFLNKTTGEQEQTLKLLESIKICYEVVSRVAPDSRCSEIMADLTRRIDSWRKPR